MTTMCQLTAEVGEDARFPELARGWFAGVLADLLADVEAGLAAGRALYKRDPRDARSYEVVQECSDVVVNGLKAGFHCDRKPNRELLDKCPWFARQ